MSRGNNVQRLDLVAVGYVRFIKILYYYYLTSSHQEYVQDYFSVKNVKKFLAINFVCQ